MIIYDIATQKPIKRWLNIGFTYPHNYQSIQLPNNQVFLVGGGAFDANPIPDSMYQSWEIETQNFTVHERCRLKFPRHGHALARIQSKFIYCIGSRKDTQESSKSVEVYNVSLDLWYEIAPLNEGRHYHSACTF
jgi:hypothetical protein